MWWRVATSFATLTISLSLRASRCIIRISGWIHIRFLDFIVSNAYVAEYRKMACMCCLLSHYKKSIKNKEQRHCNNQDSLKTFDAAAPDHGSIADDSRGLRAGELWFDPSSPTKSADPHAGCMVGVCAPSASGR